jgi:hypothetical protein
MKNATQHASRNHRPVAVYGASGHTGRFVVLELLRRGLMPVAVARNPTSLMRLEYEKQGVEVREASTISARSLDVALAGVEAVINCAGPFLDTAHAIASAALRAGIHYLDITAEQPSTRITLNAFDDAARDKGIVVMPAMGFFGGFADLLVTAAMADWKHADEIRIGIALDSWHPTSGTRITGERNTARRRTIINEQLVPLEPPSAGSAWLFPAPFDLQQVVELPFPEVILISRHIHTSALHTFLNETALKDIRDPTTPPPKAVDEMGRSAQRFAVEAVIRQGGRTLSLSARGQDIYAFTAPLVCEAVERILTGRFRGYGTQPPGAIFEAKDYLAALSPDYLTLTKGSDSDGCHSISHEEETEKQ